MKKYCTLLKKSAVSEPKRETTYVLYAPFKFGVPITPFLVVRINEKIRNSTRSTSGGIPHHMEKVFDAI